MPGVAAAFTLLVVYATTLAHGITFWDAGDFLSAIHALGIPHPPGTPLFVLLARVWSTLLSPFLSFTIAVNAFSAVCTAVGCGLLADLLDRWTHDPLAAWAAATVAGTTSTLWLNATETEVYACAFCAACVIMWVANNAAETQDTRWLCLTAYVIGLSLSLHLTAILVVPAAMLRIVLARPRHIRPRILLVLAALVLLGASVIVFMMFRARHDPAINQGNPTTWATLWDTLQRRQYDVAFPWPRRAPLWLQLGNVIEYADWQFALGFAPTPGPSWFRTPITVLFLMTGVFGCMIHRRRDLASWRTMMCVFITTTLGVVLYLNLRAGPSFGYGFIPEHAIREARERDYFFTFGFVCWGLWAGYGFVTLARRYAGRWPLVAACVCCLPILGNWSIIHYERSDEQRRAERESMMLLNTVPKNGIFLAIGDNDTYPLWYQQQVHGVRPDVTVITIPMLGASWYRAELRRRFHLLDTTYVGPWRGLSSTLANIRVHALQLGRPVVDSPRS